MLFPCVSLHQRTRVSPSRMSHTVVCSCCAACIRSWRSYMAFTLYDDLAKRKQIVLARGDFSHHLSKEVRCRCCLLHLQSQTHACPPPVFFFFLQEASHLIDLVRHYYLNDWRTVETFNTAPQEFDFQRFMDKCPRKQHTKKQSTVV